MGFEYRHGPEILRAAIWEDETVPSDGKSALPVGACARSAGPHRFHPGRVGAEVTVEQAYKAARQTGINCLAGIKQAIGDLDKVVALVRTLNFVVCAPGFTDPNLISSGLTDLFAEVFGPERGIGCRATIGVMSLANNHCLRMLDGS